MGVLNDYLAYLPPVYDSSMAVRGTKKSNVLFNEADLARIVLNLVPVTWVNWYNMTHSMLPKSPSVLLPDLEAIERVMNENHQANLKAKAKEASSASTSAKGTFLSDLQSTQPRPIKVTDPVPISNRADEKALEDAKRGKVNEVVAVMHIYGKTKSNSPNANSKNSSKKAILGSKLMKIGLN
jgi:hypothetical protein